MYDAKTPSSSEVPIYYNLITERFESNDIYLVARVQLKSLNIF